MIALLGAAVVGLNMKSKTESETQELLDSFYFKNGPCCAGCDFWRHLNSLVGECIKSPPVSGDDRMAGLGITGCSRLIGAGHVVTRRDHWCRTFEDKFDWSSLPLAYLRRIGAPITPPPAPPR